MISKTSNSDRPLFAIFEVQIDVLKQRDTQKERERKEKREKQERKMERERAREKAFLVLFWCMAAAFVNCLLPEKINEKMF